MRFLIPADAENDLIDGARFYDSLAYGLGANFIDSLLSDMDSLHLYAGVHAVLDCRRDPETIRKCIQSESS